MNDKLLPLVPLGSCVAFGLSIAVGVSGKKLVQTLRDRKTMMAQDFSVPDYVSG